jgi:hypothetical protein
MKRAILALACGIGLRGKVDVLDLVLHRHFLISAGHTYFGPS